MSVGQRLIRTPTYSWTKKPTRCPSRECVNFPRSKGPVFVEYPNAIKDYKSSVDERGEYRTYAVYPSEANFVFECSFWTLRDSDGSAVGTVKTREEYKTVEEATARYEEYLEAWEADRLS